MPGERTLIPSAQVPVLRPELWLFVKSRWKALTVCLLLAALYANVLVSLMEDWWSDPGYSHGSLALLLALYIAWKQRKLALAAPAAPSSNGLYLVGGGCLAYIAGKLGAEFFVTRMSLILVVAGLLWTFWGTKRLRQLAFPLLLVASVIPLPVIVYNSLAAPLQLLASSLATQIAQFFGVSVYRDGNIIQLADTTLGVAEACSGLRSLASLAVAGLLLGYLECSSLLARALVFLLAIPIAVVFNILRVTGTALLAERDPELALGFYHLIAGWLIFVGGFGVLFGCARLLRYLLEPKRGASAA